jgi:sigma-E factor negative regulatory protein RseC
METSVCIQQKGTVEEFTGHNIKVKIHREASCGHCGAKGLCYIGEGTERTIEISDFSSDLKIGDTVAISIARSMGNKAVMLGYMVPFIILLTTLIVLNSSGAREWLSGLLAIISLIPYYILLYLFRNRLRKTFLISARKNEN